MALAYRLFRNKWVPPADPDHLSFTGQTIIVTGSNVGLGAEAAHKLAAQGAARLILAVRSEEKGAKVQRMLQHIASDPKCKVEVWRLDMLDYDSIKAFAKRCDDELERIDIAVLNAGVVSSEYRASKYGWEHTIQVNTLSTAALAVLLMGKLRRSKTEERTPVLEFVNSGRHYVATLTDAEKNDDSINVLDSYNTHEAFNSSKMYRSSKLFLMYVAQTLAKMLQPDESKPPEVFVQSVCPGACQSELARDMDTMTLKVVKFYANLLVMRTSEEGSRTFVSGTEIGEKGHGKFWQNDVVREPAPMLVGEEGEKLRKKVWSEIVEAVAKDMPEIQEAVTP